MADIVVSKVLAPASHLLDKFQAFCTTEHNLIAEMEWETKASATLGLSLDQFRFTIALLSSVVIGLGMQPLMSPTLRHLYALFTGVALVYYPFGAGIIQVVPPAVLTYIGMALFPRYSGRITWLINFPYLIYLHVMNASGMNWNAGRMDFTGGMMVAVLKLISIAVCRADSCKKQELLSPWQKDHQLPVLPSPLEYLSYLFSLGNLLSGPYFEFTEYKQFIESKGVWDPKAPKRMTGAFLRGLLFVGESCLYMALYMKLGHWTIGQCVEPGSWYQHQNIPVRIAAIVLIGLMYQTRYYFSWKLSEASLTIAGFNFIGYSDKGKALWGRCANCNFIGVWTTDSARNVPMNWNIATGIFLRRYVYERITPRNSKPHFGHLLFTQMVSAIWHGLYPGYMMFFAGTAIWIYHSQVIYKMETNFPAALRNNFLYRFIKICWTHICLCYMASAFQLLEAHKCMQCYGSVKFIPYWVMLAVSLLGVVVKPKRAPKDPQAVATTAAAEKKAQ